MPAVPDNRPIPSLMSRNSGASRVARMGHERLPDVSSPGVMPEPDGVARHRGLGTAFVSGNGWIGSLVGTLKSNKLKALLLAGGLLFPSVAAAQDVGAQKPGAPQPADAQQKWPEAIKHRNARYAVRDRVLDEDGDAREAILRDLVLTRTQDRLGDREEQRRALALREQPPKAIAYARTDRERDPRGDAEQAFVAKLPSKERRHAELRRFRDFAGDQQELALFRINLIRFGPLRGDGIGIAQHKPDEQRELFNRERGEDTRSDNDREVSGDQDVERRDDRAAEREDERGLIDRDDERRERDLDRLSERTDRDAERDGEKQDREADKDAEREGERLDKDAERDLERKIDKGDLDSDRDTERQIQREDENNDLDD